MTSLSGLIDKLDDKLNPIIVKELRQVVRGKFFWGVLILFLTIQCVILSLSIADQGLTQRSVGAETLTFLFAILFLASFVLIPLNTGFRFARERSEGSDELLYITTITPQAIIMGKFAASMVFILLLFSAFAPFMAMTFFLSGVDFNVTFLILALGLMASAGGTILQICLGSLAKDSHTMQIFRIAGFIFQFTSFFTLNAASSDMIRYGVSRIFGSINSFDSIATFAILFLAACYFFYVAASSAIYPTGTNRMFPVRKCLSWIWALSLFICAYWAIKSGSFDIFFFWGFMAIGLISMFSFIAASERDFLTERVAREIPRGSFRGFLAFLFFSGAAGGFAWVLTMQVITILIVALIGQYVAVIPVSATHYEDFFFYNAGLLAYFIGYALIAVFIRRKFLMAYVDSKNTWVVALMVVGIFSIAPIFFGSLAGFDSSTLLIGNPMSLGQYRDREQGLVFAILLLLISVIINLPWLARQFREFSQTWPGKAEIVEVKES